MSESLFHFYPWQVAQAQAWLTQRERFAHAWLLHGVKGVGKTQFARAAAASLLCTQPQQGIACGHCEACLWCKQGNHPDLRLIRPERVEVEEGAAAPSNSTRKPSREIRVEQLRRLQGWFNTATHRGGYRVAVLYPAEDMNVISANALLKVLEEPPANTVFLLVTDASDRLLPTIVSRCRRLPLSLPTQAEALEWLQGKVPAPAEDWLAAAAGGPIDAVRLAAQQQQPYPAWLQPLLTQFLNINTSNYDTIAEELEKIVPSEWLAVLQRCCLDLQLMQFNLAPRYYPSLQPLYQKLVATPHYERIAQLAKWLDQQVLWQNHPLNSKLLVHHTLDRLRLALR